MDDRSSPLWAKVFWAILAVLAATFVVLHLLGGGFHGHHGL